MTEQPPSPDTFHFRSLLPWLLVAVVVAALAGGLVVALGRSDDADVARFNREHHTGMPLALRIARDSRPARDLEIQHTKRLHVIIARRDLTGLSHLHPQMRADGTWTGQLTLAEPGPYRVSTDFQVDAPSIPPNSP